MTNREVAVYALEQLKKNGADDAQCIVSRGKADELNVDGGSFSLMRSLLNSSISLKALVGGKKGTVSVNRLDRQSIDDAVRDCIAAAKSSVSDEAESIAPLHKNGSFVSGVLEPDLDGLYRRVAEYLQDIKDNYPKVIIEQFISSYTHAERLLMNTNGVEFLYEYGGYDFSSMFSAHEAEKASSFIGYGGQFLELDERLVDFGLQRTLLAEAEQSLNPTVLEGKFVGPILVTPACLGDLMMTALYNFISDSTLIDGTSPWIDQLGCKVASEAMTMSFNPLDPRIVTGERFTSEGYQSENMTVIQNGILKHFLLSNYGANKTRFSRALNSSQNLCIEPGTTPLSKLIASIDRGVLLNRFSGGQPGTNGDFSGVAKNSFLIENGKVTSALSETMISGNLSDMLKQVRGISLETICDGMSILPWVTFDGITVSGK